MPAADLGICDVCGEALQLAEAIRSPGPYRPIRVHQECSTTPKGIEILGHAAGRSLAMLFPSGPGGRVGMRPEAAAAEISDRIKQLQAEGLDDSAVASQLAADGWPPPPGFETWTRPAVSVVSKG